jgi:sulfur-carrier protein
MPVVWIPALLRDMTGGETAVTMPGATVKQVIEHLDERYPGMQARLCQGDRLRPNIAVVIDGEVYRSALQHRLTETSEIWFLPALSGGCYSDPDLDCSHDDGSPMAGPCPEAGTFDLDWPHGLWTFRAGLLFGFVCEKTGSVVALGFLQPPEPCSQSSPLSPERSI